MKNVKQNALIRFLLIVIICCKSIPGSSQVSHPTNPPVNPPVDSAASHTANPPVDSAASQIANQPANLPAIKLSYANPSSCNLNDGSISIKGLPISRSYHVSYKLYDVCANTTVTSNGSGVLVINNLSIGTYTNFKLESDTGGIQNVTGSVSLVGGKIATQITKFYGAAYANFTGIQDDDPTGFAQFYARLSQPLNRYRGINCDASWHDRLIFMRNFFLQLTYGNTSSFKMYTYDTLNNKYVNRLDLLAHSYFDASFSLNILTFILPKSWGTSPSGDMAHIYFDLFASLAVTNVTDTFSKSSPATDLNYNIKSNVFGLNVKASFSDAFNTNFNIDLGYRLMYISPSSSTINPNQSPQNSNVGSINYQQNSSKDFLTKGNYPYNQFEVLVSYNTGAGGTTSNQSATTSNSNVFLKYTYVSNYAGVNSKHYANNYFQFQIGYVLDISKIFYSQPATTASTAK